MSYIASVSSTLSPIGNAVVGAVGESDVRFDLWDLIRPVTTKLIERAAQSL